MSMSTRQNTGAMADLIRQTFADSGMSLKRLSVRSGVPYACVHGFFTGKRDPALSTIQKWADELGLEFVLKRRKRKGGA